MHERPSLLCPDCGGEMLIESNVANPLAQCPRCRRIQWTVPPVGTSQAMDKPTRDAFEPIHPGIPAPACLETPQDEEPAFPDVRSKEATTGESLAVTALVIPLLASAISFLVPMEFTAAHLAISCSALLVTIVLLTIDALWLGRIDLKGTKRENAFALFAGMVLFWMIFFPLAYFRRRHFGKTNFGPLALIVVAFFLTAPFGRFFFDRSQDRFPGQPARGLPVDRIQDESPPRCDDADVIFLVDDMIRIGPIGKEVASISDYREIRHDVAGKKRRGRCTVKTEKMTWTITFEVAWVDARRGAFRVAGVPLEDDPRGYLELWTTLPDAETAKQLKKNEGGVYVAEVFGMASREGIKRGDLLVRFNGQGFERATALERFDQRLIDLEPETKVSIEVVRDGKRTELQVTIQKRPLDVPDTLERANKEGKEKVIK